MTDKQKKEFKIVEIQGKAMYAKVHTPVKFNEKDIPSYEIELVVSDSEAKRLKELGLSVTKKKITDKETDEERKIPKEYPEYKGQKVFKFFRKTVRSDGTENTPLPVVDAKTNPIPKTILIGNGSEVLVSINPYSTTNKQGKLVHGANLLAVQVLDLVPYKSKVSEYSFTQKEGFTVDTSVISTVDDDDEAIPF